MCSYREFCDASVHQVNPILGVINISLDGTDLTSVLAILMRERGLCPFNLTQAH